MTYCNGIVIGKMYIDHVGEMVIQNVKTGDNLKITFKSQKGSGMFSKKDAYEVSGKIFGIHEIFGRWNEFLQVTIQGSDRPIELWRFP